jgi:hypothetical protein
VQTGIQGRTDRHGSAEKSFRQATRQKGRQVVQAGMQVIAGRHSGQRMQAGRKALQSRKLGQNRQATRPVRAGTQT